MDVTETKKHLPFIVIGGIAVVLAAAALVFFGGKSLSHNGADDQEATYAYAKVDDDGTAYIPLTGGKYITIKDDVDSAFLTGDRQHIIVLLKDGTLYITDKKQSSKKQIADNCKMIYTIKNDGFFYADKNEIVSRVLFSDASTLALGKDVAFITAANNTSVIYATDDGNIYTVKSTETENNKVGTYNSSVDLEAISDDGEISVWVVKNRNSTQIIMLNDGEDKQTLGQVDGKYNHTYATFTDDQGMLIIGNLDSDCLWLKYPGKELTKINLGAELADGTVYTDKGRLSDVRSKDVGFLYVSTESDTVGSNIYSISTEGDREKLLSKIEGYYIANGNIIYTDTDNTLYYAALDNDTVSDAVKIASDVDMYEVSDNGKYVYYMRDCEDYAGTLYGYKIGEDDPLKVASDVACYTGKWGSGFMYNTYSVDGSSVLFLKDMSEIPDTYSEQGSLMLWNYGDENTTKVASDVIEYSVTSNFESGEVNIKDFVFDKYSFVDSDEQIHVNWMHYDGKEAVKFASDVIR